MNVISTTQTIVYHLTKVMLPVVINRMRNKILPKISETQFGFIADKCTRIGIFSLFTGMEKANQVQKELYPCFIENSTAFGKVKYSNFTKT